MTTSRSSSFVHMHVLHEAVLNMYVRVRTNWHRNICTHGFHRCFCPLDLSIRVNVQIFFFPEKQSKRSWHHPLKESTKPSGLNTKQRHRTQTHAHRHNGKSASTHTHFLYDSFSVQTFLWSERINPLPTSFRNLALIKKGRKKPHFAYKEEQKCTESKILHGHLTLDQ